MNAIERAVILSDGPVLRKDLLPSELRVSSSQGPDVSHVMPSGSDESLPYAWQEGLSFQDAKRQAVQSFETAFLRAALGRHAGNVNQTALSLGLKRQALQQKLKELGIDPNIYRL
jgi:DNA-binding NtrC family response regulator